MNFKSLRKKAEMTQCYLASLLGVSRSTIAKWESGNSKPRAGVLIKLSRILGCTTDELLGIVEAKPHENKNPPTGGRREILREGGYK